MKKKQYRHKESLVIVFCFVAGLLSQRFVYAQDWGFNKWGYQETEEDRAERLAREKEKEQEPVITENEERDEKGNLLSSTTVTVIGDTTKIETSLYYKNGNKKSQKFYNQGYPTLIRNFYEDGVPQQEMSFKDGRLEGPSNKYFPNGSIKESFFYRAGLRHGVNRTFFENGNMEEEMSYRLGQLTGPVKKFYENGRLRFQGQYKKDQLSGEVKECYNNGQLKSKGVYKEGLKEGAWTEYYENGGIKKQSFYVKGQQDGLQKIFHENGLLAYKEDYQNGRLKRAQQVYTPDKTLESFEDEKYSLKITSATQIDRLYYRRHKWYANKENEGMSPGSRLMQSVGSFLYAKKCPFYSKWNYMYLKDDVCPELFNYNRL